MLDFINNLAPIVTVILLLILVFRNPSVSFSSIVPHNATKEPSREQEEEEKPDAAEEMIIDRLSNVAVHENHLLIRIDAIGALANFRHNESAAKQLVTLSSSDQRQEIREAALGAMGLTGMTGERISPVDNVISGELIRIAEGDDPSIASEAIRSLAKFGHVSYVTDSLIKLTNSSDPTIRTSAIRSLGGRA